MQILQTFITLRNTVNFTSLDVSNLQDYDQGLVVFTSAPLLATPVAEYNDKKYSFVQKFHSILLSTLFPSPYIEWSEILSDVSGLYSQV